MPQAEPVGRWIALVAALLVASPAAAAGKRAKAKRAIPARESRAEPKSPAAEPAPTEVAAPVTEPVPESPEPESSAEPGPPGDLESAERAAPTAASTSEKATDTPATPDVAPAATAGLERREALRLAAGRIEVAAFAGASAGGRSFRYSDAIGRLLAPYRLSVAPMASFELEAYPLASTNLPGLRDVGFRGHVSRAFAVDSSTPDGAVIDTSWTRFGGELRYRVIVPGRRRFELGILAGVDADYFVMSTASKVAALVPSARTIAARFGLDTELLVASRFSILLGGSYLMTTSRGEIYDRFRKPHVAGVDANIGVALALAPGLSARLGGRYTRYFARFSPEVGDAAVAGGALDQRWQGSLGVRYAH